MFWLVMTYHAATDQWVTVSASIVGTVQTQHLVRTLLGTLSWINPRKNHMAEEWWQDLPDETLVESTCVCSGVETCQSGKGE